jgi:hypothetical protein
MGGRRLGQHEVGIACSTRSRRGTASSRLGEPRRSAGPPLLEARTYRPRVAAFLAAPACQDLGVLKGRAYRLLCRCEIRVAVQIELGSHLHDGFVVVVPILPLATRPSLASGHVRPPCA